MATRSTMTFMEETAPCAALNQPLQTCPEVLSTIYTAHYRHVLRVCRRFFRRPEDAEDAAAEVFLKLHRVLETRNEEVPFLPWVSQVAGRHCIDKLRRGKREKDSCMDGADVSEVPDYSNPSPLSQVLRKEEWLEVREQLIRLPKKYKVPLETNELLRDRARTEKADSCGPDDDLPRQRATAPQFATRAVCQKLAKSVLV